MSQNDEDLLTTLIALAEEAERAIHALRLSDLVCPVCGDYNKEHSNQCVISTLSRLVNKANSLQGKSGYNKSRSPFADATTGYLQLFCTRCNNSKKVGINNEACPECTVKHSGKYKQVVHFCDWSTPNDLRISCNKNYEVPESSFKGPDYIFITKNRRLYSFAESLITCLECIKNVR